MAYNLEHNSFIAKFLNTYTECTADLVFIVAYRQQVKLLQVSKLIRYLLHLFHLGCPLKLGQETLNALIAVLWRCLFLCFFAEARLRSSFRLFVCL